MNTSQNHLLELNSGSSGQDPSLVMQCEVLSAPGHFCLCQLSLPCMHGLSEDCSAAAGSAIAAGISVALQGCELGVQV